MFSAALASVIIKVDSVLYTNMCHENNLCMRFYYTNFRIKIWSIVFFNSFSFFLSCLDSTLTLIFINKNIWSLLFICFQRSNHDVSSYSQCCLPLLLSETKYPVKLRVVSWGSVVYR